MTLFAKIVPPFSPLGSSRRACLCCWGLPRSPCGRCRRPCTLSCNGQGRWWGRRSSGGSWRGDSLVRSQQLLGTGTRESQTLGLLLSLLTLVDTGYEWAYESKWRHIRAKKWEAQPPLSYQLSLPALEAASRIWVPWGQRNNISELWKYGSKQEDKNVS